MTALSFAARLSLPPSLLIHSKASGQAVPSCLLLPHLLLTPALAGAVLLNLRALDGPIKAQSVALAEEIRWALGTHWIM